MIEDEKIELKAKLADETLRADALAAELELVRASPSWQAVEMLRLRGRNAEFIAKVFRKVAIFFLRRVPGFGLRKRVDPHVLQRSVNQLTNSPLFDPAWYGEDDDAAEHYLQTGAHAGRDPGPLFDNQWYQKTNPDLGGQNPLLHYLDIGAKEGRLGWSVERVIALQKPYFTDTKRALLAVGAVSDFPTLQPGQQVRVYVSSLGNTFFTHVRDMLCSGLQQAGIAAKPGDETNWAMHNEQAIIVAPHEFFYLGVGQKLQNSPKCRAAICVNTEQMQTKWFSHAFPFLAKCAGVLDMNVQSAAVLADIGIPTKFLAPGYLANDPVLGQHESLPSETATSSFGPDVIAAPPPVTENLAKRPIDVLFVGGNTPRREAFFAKAAPALADKTCAVYLTDMSRPISDGGGVGLSAAAFAGLSQRTKIQLNIHQGVLPYFEWHRMTMHGFWHRTAVVTETSFRTPEYEPGVHYFEDELAKLPDLLSWLLNSKDGSKQLEKVSTNAFNKLRSSQDMAQILRDVFQIPKTSPE